MWVRISKDFATGLEAHRTGRLTLHAQSSSPRAESPKEERGISLTKSEKEGTAIVFWEIYQQSQIHDAKSQAAAATSKTLSLKEELSRLEGRIDSLALTCQAMWELIRERTTLTDNDIEDRMEQIDLRDGKADGKMQMPALKCTDCGRVIHRRHARCLYCGVEFRKPHVFE